jgi:hypothetical protein
MSNKKPTKAILFFESLKEFQDIARENAHHAMLISTIESQDNIQAQAHSAFILRFASIHILANFLFMVKKKDGEDSYNELREYLNGEITKEINLLQDWDRDGKLRMSDVATKEYFKLKKESDPTLN